MTARWMHCAKAGEAVTRRPKRSASTMSDSCALEHEPSKRAAPRTSCAVAPRASLSTGAP
ncbi:MAG: hypothetical protein U0326_17055 [Polyangiales bacterium]